ncbi:mitogen-activated protein kinase kinase kinase 12-like [Panulirus ornatus]|uniref:mitogen-activated protein kinase kinase kinase 12-like n=1 Tax=Panulirus ornatus TaxID=150431 RepID=UPI003A889E7A
MRDDQQSDINVKDNTEVDTQAQKLTEIQCVDEPEEEHNQVIDPVFLIEEGIDKIKFIKKLHEGGNGIIDKVLFNGDESASKTLHPGCDLFNLLNEAAILCHLKGAGGAPFLYGLSQVPARIIMSFAGSPYEKYLQTRSEKEIVDSLISIVDQLQEIHEAGVIHNDIRIDNITVTYDDGVSFHFVDFSLSTMEGQVLKLVGEGENPWMSPESMNREPLSPASDVFSLGCLFNDIQSYVHKE